MLKGYLERVVGSGIGFGSGVEYPKPLVNVRLVQISTSSSSTPWLNEKGVPSALHTLFDNYIADVFGAQATYRLHLDAIAQDMRADHAAGRLLEVEQFADRVRSEEPTSELQALMRSSHAASSLKKKIKKSTN